MSRYPSDDIFKIVTAGPDQGSDFAKFHGRVFARGWSPSSFESLLQDPNVSALLVLQGQDPNSAGLRMIIVEDSEAKKRTIAVAPHRRRQRLERRFAKPWFPGFARLAWSA